MWALAIGEAISVRGAGFGAGGLCRSLPSSSTQSLPKSGGAKEATNPLTNIVDIPDDEEINPSFQRFSPHFTLRTPATPMQDKNVDAVCESLAIMIGKRIRSLVAKSCGEPAVDDSSTA